MMGSVCCVRTETRSIQKEVTLLREVYVVRVALSSIPVVFPTDNSFQWSLDGMKNLGSASNKDEIVQNFLLGTRHLSERMLVDDFYISWSSCRLAMARSNLITAPFIHVHLVK